MMKVEQDVSGCFRTWKGAEEFCGIRSYISAAGRQRVDVLDAIHNALLGRPFIPARANPAEYSLRQLGSGRPSCGPAWDLQPRDPLAPCPSARKSCVTPPSRGRKSAGEPTTK
jgi:hypothetical protein